MSDLCGIFLQLALQEPPIIDLLFCRLDYIDYCTIYFRVLIITLISTVYLSLHVLYIL